jgi:hypothetical protein
MRHIGIVRKVRCHNGSVMVSAVRRFGGLAHAGAVERDAVFLFFNTEDTGSHRGKTRRFFGSQFAYQVE